MSRWDFEHPADKEKRLAAEKAARDARLSAFTAVAEVLATLPTNDAQRILDALPAYLGLVDHHLSQQRIAEALERLQAGGAR